MSGLRRRGGLLDARQFSASVPVVEGKRGLHRIPRIATRDGVQLLDQRHDRMHAPDGCGAVAVEFVDLAGALSLMTAGEIGQKVCRVLCRHKMAKHFEVQIKDGVLDFRRNEESIRRGSELGGIYVIRTSEPSERLSAENTVRSYKLLTQVEQGFRCMKGIDLRVRPVFHRSENRVRAHFFLCRRVTPHPPNRPPAHGPSPVQNRANALPKARPQTGMPP